MSKMNHVRFVIICSCSQFGDVKLFNDQTCKKYQVPPESAKPICFYIPDLSGAMLNEYLYKFPKVKMSSLWRIQSFMRRNKLFGVVFRQRSKYDWNVNEILSSLRKVGLAESYLQEINQIEDTLVVRLKDDSLF
ncbi:Uncharacterised protein [uncultured archaeon]|nr:Uncharacterised protein [uncultured archaeon]